LVVLEFSKGVRDFYGTGIVGGAFLPPYCKRHA